MKLYISREADRDQVCMILCRNGYTVRQGKGKRKPEDAKKASFVEVLEDGIRETASAGGYEVGHAALYTGSVAGTGTAAPHQE